MVNIDRRQFLAVGGAGTAGLALENQARRLRTTDKPWNAGTARSLRKFRDPVATACTACGPACAVRAYRDGDRVVQLLPNRAAGPLAGTCPRAFHALEALYDPERLRVPLRRTGPRGGGGWQEISWGEAIDLLAGALVRSPERAYVDLGRPDPLAGPILQGLGVRHLIDHETSRRWAAREAQRAVYGAPLAPPDLSRVRTLLLVGERPLEEGPGLARTARQVIDARQRGCRVVALSPYQGVTGSLAHEWVPLRPGAETLAVLGLVRVILTNGWYDARAFSQAVATPPERILEALFPYSVDLVGQATGLTAPTLERLARGFTDGGPALCLVGSDGTRSADALEAGAAVLNSLRGDPEGSGARLAHRPHWLAGPEPTAPRTRAVKDILAGNERASVYLAYRSNPVYWSPRSESVRRAFADADRIELVVAFDTHRTETGEVADLLLPAASDLECWNLLGGFLPDGRPHLVLQQPATRTPAEPRQLRAPDAPAERLFDGPAPGPLGGARQLGDVLLEVLARSGHPARGEFPFPGTGAYVRHLADTTLPVAADGGFDRLARDGVWVGPRPEYPWAAERGYATPSGLVEVGRRLVHRVPTALKRLEGDAFALVVLRHAELDPAFPNTRWGREIRHENPVFMHPESARALGVGSGDRVLLRTAVGEARARVVTLEGIHPRAVAVAEDFGHWAGGVAATARGERAGGPPRSVLVTRQEFLTNPLGRARQPSAPAEAPWWHHHGPGVSIPALAPFASDAFGAQAWRELRVSVRPT